MCTLTLLPIHGVDGRGLRLAFNRDESRRRAKALSPRRFICGGHNVLMPIDPESTGTWIALSDVGIALAVMNINPCDSPERSPRQSRGAIIPALLKQDSLETMRDAVRRLYLEDFAPFRLVLATADQVSVLEHRDGTLHQAPQSPDAPLMFTSSGLGDHLVEAPRRELFQAMLQSPSSGMQDAFHRHQWADRPHLSVCMTRQDAHTVSHTLVHLAAHRATMLYVPDAPNQPVQPEIHSLDLCVPENACL